jgi:P pilus assembly chaperone PapD
MTSTLRNSFLALLLMVLYVPAYAVIGLNPEFQKIEFKPRQKITGTIDVSNKGAEEIKVQVQPEDWTDQQHIVRGGVSWLKVKPETFFLKPGAVQKVSFTAKIPKDAPRQYVTQMFFATRALQHSDMGVGVRIAALIHWKKKVQ